DDHMFSTIKLVSRHQNTQQFGALLPIELTNKEIRNSNAYKEYYAIVTGTAPPKPKASVRRTRSSSDTSITPPTAAASPRLTASTHISQASGLGADEGTGSIPGVPDAPTNESEEELSWNSTDGESVDDEGKDGDDDEEDEGDDGEEGDGDDDDEDDDGEEGNDDDDDQEVIRDDDKDDEEEGGDDEQEYDDDESDEETRDEESFDPIPDVNINQGKGLQTTLDVEDSHVTLTPVNPDGQQQSSSVSSQFVTSMLNTTLDVVKVAVQIESDHLRDEAQRDNDEFLKTAVNEQLEAEVLTRSSHSSKTSYAVAADLLEIELKKILIEKMEGNKSIQRSNEQRNLYKALVEAYKSDKIILDTYGETVTLKRRRDDDGDKDEEPSAGPDRGSKRCREGKEPESASAPTETATRSAGRSKQGSRSRQVSVSESDLAKEHMQTTSQMEEPSHSEFDIGAEDQLIVQSSQHPKWFSQQQKPPSPDHAWNKTVMAVHGSIQPWISELVKQSDSRSSFNELMDTPLDFSNFLINRLKVNPEGQQYPHNLLKPLSLISNNRGCCVIPFEHFINNDLEYLRGGASSRKYTTSITKTKAADYGHIKWIEDLIVEWHSYKHLDWITVQRDDDKLYKFKEGDFKRLRIQDIKDMLLLLVQGKLTNLTVEERFAFNVSLQMFTRSIRKEAYTAYSNPRGFIYQNKDKKNRLMRIDELHKFSDGTLTDVRTALDDRLKEI
nr:hypothetical protein [Tanacetum cinerariifolium]